MRRRDFIKVIGGSVAAWPLAARGQQAERVRRIGVLMAIAPGDPEAQLRVKAFESAWPELGWVRGRNIQVDYRWAAGDLDNLRSRAAELVATAPEVVLTIGTPVLTAVRAATQSIPIVFAGVSDPDGTGVVVSMARPGGQYHRVCKFRADD